MFKKIPYAGKPPEGGRYNRSEAEREAMPLAGYIPTVISHPVQKKAKGRPMNNGWPEAMRQKLIEYCQTPMSFRQIASALNSDFPNEPPKSRNAVLGKAMRMSLNKVGAPGSNKQRPQRLKPRKPSAFKAPATASTSLAAFPEVILEGEEMLRPEGRIPRTGMRSRRLSSNDPELAERLKGHVPNIVELKPLTSKPVHESDVGECQWPTSSDIRCMEVCGASAKIGAYCIRHAQVAYRQMPTKRRNRSFGRA